MILRNSGSLISSVSMYASTRPTSPGYASPCQSHVNVTISTQGSSLTRPFMISSIVYSAYSSFTLTPAASSSSVGAGGGGKQFGIMRCLAAATARLSPFDNVPLGSEEAGRESFSSFGVVAPEVVRDEAGVKIWRRKKNFAWLTASRCCARRMFSSTCKMSVSGT